ncbi:hypothetical protein BS17DRAFT_807993 [Gyrodon lividus]|nr:hypothetical protein BS17DRAFT_807993 [Gyrodon lividus]
MRQCLNLSRLPKATAPKSLNTRHTTPGYANPSHIDHRNIVDRHHPAARLTLRAFPAFTCPAFSMRAMPKATLSRPAFVPPDPLLVTRRTPTRKKKSKDTLDISLLFHVMKKSTSKRAVLRKKLRTKMTSAIALVVTRGADAVDVSGGLGVEAEEGTMHTLPVDSYPPLMMVVNPMPVDRHLVLKDWTYVITPNLKVYRMPLPNLVQAVRKALTFLKHHASRMEASWESMPARKPIKKRSHQTPQREPTWVNDAQRTVIVSPPTRYDETVSGAAQGGQLGNLENLASSHPVASSRQKYSGAVPKLFFPSRSATSGRQKTDRGTPGSDTSVSPGYVQPSQQPETNVMASARARMFVKRPVLLRKEKKPGDGG